MRLDLNVPIASLEYSLQRFLESDITRPFSISDVTVEPHLIQGLASDTKKTENPIMDFEEPLATAVNKDIENIKNIPEFKSLGDVYQSSRLIDVTESEAEYRVTCIKHMFIDHVLLQFNVTNFMDDQILTNIYVETDPNNLGWSEEMVVPIELLNPQDSGICYVCIRRPGDEYVSGLISATLKFNFRELDEDGDGVEDEYHLEDLEILATDYVKPGEDMSVQEFRALWEECGSDNEQVKRFGLSMNNLQSAVDTIIGSLNMRAIMESSRVPEGARSHTANLIGSFVDGEKILARTGFLQDATTNAITLKVASRASRMNLSQIVPNSIR